MSNTLPNNPEGVNENIVPPGMRLSSDGTTMTFGNLTSPTYSQCCKLQHWPTWQEYGKVLNVWIEQASDESIFKFLRGNFNRYISPSGENKENILKKRVLNFLWDKNPELQNKYPNFEGISRLTEAEKQGFSEKTNELHISVLFVRGDGKGELNIYTRPDGDDGEFVEHRYLIDESGVAVYKGHITQGELNVEYQKGETQRAVLDSLLKEANGDQLKIAQAFLAHAVTLKAKYGSGK